MASAASPSPVAVSVERRAPNNLRSHKDAYNRFLALLRHPPPKTLARDLPSLSLNPKEPV